MIHFSHTDNSNTAHMRFTTHGQTWPFSLQPTGPVCLATKPASHECKTYIRSVAKCYPPRPLRCQFCCPRGSQQSAFLYRNYWQNLSQSARTAYLVSNLNLTDVFLQRLKGSVDRHHIKRDIRMKTTFGVTSYLLYLTKTCLHRSLRNLESTLVLFSVRSPPF